MNVLSLKQVKKLYNIYSPLASSKKLYDNYINITGDDSSSIEHIREIYNKRVFQGFLNEAVIKSSFIRKYCLNRSTNHTITIFELNTGNSRADLCMINGSSIVFEIKTEYDTLFRLDKQLSDYKNSFDFLNLIIPDKLEKSVVNEIDPSIGIIVYYKNRLNNISFEVRRHPQRNSEIDPKFQLNQLTKQELRQISKLNASKEFMIESLLLKNTQEQVNNLYKTTVKNKYKKQWKYLVDNKDDIIPLDYQWFFKNNLSTNIVYK